MPELTNDDAIMLAIKYYRGINYQSKDIARVLDILKLAGITGLIIHAYNQGVLDERGEHNA